MASEENPYAPPVTSDPAGDLPDVSPDRRKRLVRSLWPLYLLTLLRSAAVMLWFRFWFTVPDQRQMAEVHGYSMLGGMVLAVPLVALLGDRRAARVVLLAGLILMAASLVASPLLSAGLVLPAITMTLRHVGSTAATMIIVAYLLRSVTVHGVYVAFFLLQVAEGLGGTAKYLGLLLDRPIYPLLAAAGALLLGTLTLLRLPAPDEATLPQSVPDPLSQPPLRLLRALALLALLEAMSVLGGLIELVDGFHDTGSLVAQLHQLPLLLGLLLPFLAFRRRWAPGRLALGGMLTGAAGALVTSASRLGFGVPLAATGRSIFVLGFRVLFHIATPALLRQQLPLPRLARWYSLRWLFWAPLQAATTLPLRLMQDNVTAIIPFAALAMLLLVPALWWVTREQ